MLPSDSGLDVRVIISRCTRSYNSEPQIGHRRRVANKSKTASRNGQAPADVRNAAHSRRGSSAINRIDRAARRGNGNGNVNGNGNSNGGGASRSTKALIHASAHEAPAPAPRRSKPMRDAKTTQHCTYPRSVRGRTITSWSDQSNP